MKKVISILLLFALLLSCCACGKQETAAPEEPSGVPTLAELLAQMEEEEKASRIPPEDTYGHIDQTVPVDGVYQIWNAEGVQLMAEHPDATFQLLCSIDMQGATVRPIGTKDQPFTGEIQGQNCILSNFTVEASADGYLGFIGVNNGKIHDITLDSVTYVVKDNTKYMGGIAAVSTTDISRCTVRGIMDVTTAAEDAVCGGFVGATTAGIINSVAEVHITYTAPGSATIGGMAGSCENAGMEFTETYGDLVVTGDNKQVGMILGQGKAVTLQNVAFLGAKNTLNDKLLEAHFGSQEEVTFEKLLTRDNGADPLPENAQKLRDRVAQEMVTMGSVEWSTSENLYHDCTCLLTVCHGNYMPGRLHVGIPYNHKGGSMARFQACVDENNVAQDWVYDLAAFDGFDSYVGNDCSTAVAHAWWTVSNSTDFIRCTYQNPQFDTGCIPVGDWSWEVGIDPETGNNYTGTYTEPYVYATGEQQMYECYALMRKGDSYYSISKDGGHTRMVAADPVVVRDENGLIDPTHSYVLSHEQGAPAIEDPYFCTWRLDYKYTFGNLYQSNKVPVTCEELLTGEMETAICEMVGGQDGKLGLTTGTVQANYFLDSVELVITDSRGTVVMDHRMFTTVGRFYDSNSNDNGIRNYNDSYDMAGFAAPLQSLQLENGETYSYTVTAYLATGDSFMVKDGSFTNGQA